jgi:hypothetical protein
MTLTIGVDIGQRIDPTAIVVAEQREHGGETNFWIRHLERRPLGEGYPLVAARVAEVVTNAVRHVRRPRYATGDDTYPAGWVLSDGFDFDLAVCVAIDVTGVGRPVAELIVAALQSSGLDALHANLVIDFATFTHGQRLSWADGERRVGKAFLVSRLQALLHTDRVRLPQTAEARALADELMHFEIRVDPDGDAKFGAFKTGTHDDLVTALGLAVLQDRLPALGGTFDYRNRRMLEPTPAGVMSVSHNPSRRRLF